MGEIMSRRRGSASSRHRSAPLGKLADGTPYYTPPGELAHDLDDGTVQCGLCGEWFAALPPHLRQTHDGPPTSTGRSSA
jgi:hypothetical protein